MMGRCPLPILAQSGNVGRTALAYARGSDRRGQRPMDEQRLLTVDYSKTLEQMIADGKYDWKNSEIKAKNFPLNGQGTTAVNIELVHFNRNIESDTALAELDKMGLRPATLPELLAFGAKYPDKQREFPIVALGSVWRSLNGDRYVACLCCDGSKRFLRLFWLEDGWAAFCRFAAVRKSA